MLRISRGTSVAMLVCAAALVGTAALAAPPDWQYRQLAQWGVGGDNWTGGFGGVQIGGLRSSLITSEFDAFSGFRTNRFDDSGSGFGGGVNFGYNWQVRGRYVVGVVGDINGLHEKVRHDFPFDAYIGSTMNFTASVQGRGGVLVTPNVLLYVQGGLSISNQRLEIDFGGPETNESKILPGFTLGGGIEGKLPASMPWGKSASVFVGYQHTWWDTARLDRPIAAPFSNYTWQRDTDKIDLGMRWRFF